MKDVSKSVRFWWIGTAIVSALAVFAVIGVGIYLAVANSDLRGQVATAHDDLRASQQNAESLYAQLLSEGVRPDAERPEDVVTAPGAPGAQGPRGEAGRAPTSDEVQRAVERFCAPLKGCVGPQGAPGPAGEKGTPGVPGSPGEAGAQGGAGANGNQGPPGPIGPAGPAGGAGQTGPAGPTGTPGSPPAGWTFTHDGITYTCGPTDPFTPDAPTYTCTGPEPTNPEE